MEKSMNKCPQCREPYSCTLPKTQHYSRCGLPLTLHCGHGVCYHCIASKRFHSKHGLTNKGPDSTISCAVCKCLSIVPHESVQNVLAVINCYQLGLIKLNDLGVDMAGENIGFKGVGGLFVPRSPEMVVNRPQPPSTSEKCLVHNISMDYWCYADEVMLCSSCRISSHLGHDVVKIQDRNKEELDRLYGAADEAVELVGEMKKTCNDLNEQTGRVKSEYDDIIKTMRSHFADLHSLLAAREQQIQHELFQKFQERTGSLKNAERYIREGYLDMTTQLQKAMKAISSDIPPSRSAISRLTESIRKSNSCKDLVDETRKNLNSVTLSAVCELNEEFTHHLRHDTVATLRSEYEGFSYWNRLLSQFDDFKQEKDRQSLDHFNATSPCEPSEKKRARKHAHVNSPQLAVNQYESGMKLTARVVHVDSHRFYIQVQSSPEDLLEEIHKQIQNCQSKPAPRLSELHPGQLVAGLFHECWYRSLIEEVNVKCDDLVIFFVDYGNRELTTTQSIRLLDDGMSVDLPAQAVRCAQTESNTLMPESLSKLINVRVDRVEPGGVGRLDEREYTLHVTLDRSDEERPIQNFPPNESVDPFVAYPPSRLHKVVRTLLAPPPPEAMVAKRKRYPAKDWIARKFNGPSDPSNSLHHPVVITESSSVPHSSSVTHSLAVAHSTTVAQTVAHSLAVAHSPAVTQTLVKSTVKPKPVLSQSPVYLPPPPAVYEGQENRFRTKIVVSHLNSPGDFYVRNDEAEKIYANMTRQLDLHFAKSSLLLEQLKPAEVKTVGQVCATNADGQWNRCLIVDIVDDKTVTVRLIDVGKMIKASCTQLFRLDSSRWKFPGLALECRLWGVRPAGHITKWSGSATDKMKRAIKTSKALFIQNYYDQVEEIGDTGIFQSVYFVRFFYEYIKPGGPLEFDQTLTRCFNDQLLDGEMRLAFREKMLVTIQPTPLRWLPSVTLPPEMEKAMPVWIDADGLIYIHRPIGPTNHVATINKLISWHYENSTSDAADLAHWVKDDPCVVLYTDMMWYRAVVLSADDESKSASVLFVDYGNSDEVPYQNMRKSLLCYDYPIQASRCRLFRYPGPVEEPTENELEMLHKLMIDKKITVRVMEPASNGFDPVVDIWFTDEGAKDLKDIFSQLRPGYKYSSSPSKTSDSLVGSPVALVTPPPTVPLSSVDLEDSIFDVESEFSDDVYPIFNFDVTHESKEMDVYRPLRIPRRASLPIHVVTANYDECQCVFSPQRYSLKDSPGVWQEQVENYARLHTELQRAAPLFPDVGVIESGSPCACHDEKKDRWHRGKILGYADEELCLIRVELVDMGINLSLPSCKIKQLPSEYLRLPRHSAKAKMIDPAVPLKFSPDLDHVRSLIKRQEENYFLAFFREVNEPLKMSLWYKTNEGKVISAIE